MKKALGARLRAQGETAHLLKGAMNRAATRRMPFNSRLMPCAFIYSNTTFPPFTSIVT